MRDLRVAMIGAGFMGKAHSLAYAMAPVIYKLPVRVHRQVVVDVTDALAAAAAETLNFTEAATRWQEVVARADIDIVDIATPNDSHEEIAVAAARNGKHVICEKPLALDAGGAERMWRAAEQAGVVNMSAYNYRKTPAIAYARTLIESGEIGTPYMLRFNYLQDWGLSGAPYVWRYNRKLAGSGAIGDIGSHAIDSAEYMLGEIRRVTGVVRTLTPTRPQPSGVGEPGVVDVDDVAVFIAEFASGAIGTFTASRHSLSRKNQLGFELDASAGALKFNWEARDELHVSLSTDPAAVSGFRKVNLGPAHPTPWWPIAGMGTGYLETSTNQVHDFLTAIVNGGRVRPDVRDGTHVARVVDAVLASSESGAWVNVESVQGG